jgi:hypothetical protein
MPRRGHSSGLRACSAGHSDSETRSESDSDAGQHPPAGLGQVSRIIRAPVRVDTRVTCPGCGLDFANLDILKRHRNARRLANAACRAAATAMKRPRPVRRAAGDADSDGDGPGDAEALIDRMMMGNGHRGEAPEDSDVQDPSRYPSRHGDGVSEPNNVCIMCASCLHIVCILFKKVCM